MSALPLDDFKRDLPGLLAVLGLERAGSNRCPFHDDRNNSFSIYQSEAGAWRWKCFAGCGQGTIVDALALAKGISPADAIKQFAGPAPASFTHSTPRVPLHNPEPVVPVPDEALVHQLFSQGFENIITGKAASALNARGIASTEWFEKNPILGYVECLNVPKWRRPIERAWLLLVTDSGGRYLALKAHFEKPHNGQKSLWLPVGTYPTDKPKHAALTFWPPPEKFDPKEWLFLCPGELKSAAIIAAGLQSTSITAGESHRWTPGLVDRLRNRRVCINFDDDPAGHRFKENTLLALRSAAAELKAVTFGRKGKR